MRAAHPVHRSRGVTPSGTWRGARAACLVSGLLLLAPGCSRDRDGIAPLRYAEPDRLFEILEANVRGNPAFEIIVDIDHSRLAQDAGSTMPPAHVLLWSDPALDAALLQQNPLAGLDLPLRALAFEDQQTGKAAVIANSYDYVARRHALPEDAALRERYGAALARAMAGLPDSVIAHFAADAMPDAGVVTLRSVHDFGETARRVQAAIDAQADAVTFGRIDFAERAKAQDVVLPPTVLILFGGPGPGGKAMASAPTLGLDAFCQKLLIWQDDSGSVHVSFNDLLALADRQQVSGGVPLRLINRRLRQTFAEALAP